MLLIFKKYIYKIYNIYKIKYKQLFFFVLPNFSKIYKKKIDFDSGYPLFRQRTVFTGEGKVKIGKNCKFGYNLKRGIYGSIEFQSRFKNTIILIGDNVSTNNNLLVCAANKIVIGKKTLIGENVTILDHEAHGIHPDLRNRIGEIGKVIIKENVWLGNNVTILKNTIIGDNTIVATGSVVSGEFPSIVIIGGIPAKIIKKIQY